MFATHKISPRLNIKFEFYGSTAHEMSQEYYTIIKNGGSTVCQATPKYQFICSNSQTAKNHCKLSSA